MGMSISQVFLTQYDANPHHMLRAYASMCPQCGTGRLTKHRDCGSMLQELELEGRARTTALVVSRFLSPAGKVMGYVRAWK